MSKAFALYYTNTDAIDPLGSVIINTNTTGSPNYSWLSVNTVKLTGAPGIQSSNILPYKDTSSYKIKFLDSIIKYNDVSSTVGDSVCISSVNSCNGTGPFFLNGQRYYIDYLFMYFVNTGTEVLYAPTLAVDTSRCSSDYGIFIGAPRVPAGTTVQLTGTPNNSLLNKNTVSYTNDLSGIIGPNSSIVYNFSLVDTSNIQIASALPDYLTMVNLVNGLVSISTTTNGGGQTSVIGKDQFNAPITLNPNGPVAANSFYPFIIFRYVAENASDRPINVSFSAYATSA